MIAQNVWIALLLAAGLLFGVCLAASGCQHVDHLDQRRVDRESQTRISNGTITGGGRGPDLVNMAGEDEMHLEIGGLGDLMRRYFERNPEHRRAFDDGELSEIMEELDHVDVWVVVLVEEEEGSRRVFGETAEPQVVFNPEARQQLVKTETLEGRPDLVYVGSDADGKGRYLYFGVVIEWIAREGKGVQVNADELDRFRNEMNGEVARGLIPRAAGFSIDIGDIRVEARSPGTYKLRDPQEGPSGGWTE